MNLSDDHKRFLLKLARDSITYGLEHDSAAPVDTASLPEPLRLVRATFVTLTKENNLRGCIGMLEAVNEIARDISTNAFSAAFRDPRFPAVSASELDEIKIDVSILSPMQPFRFTSESDLARQLEPGIDGVLIDDGRHRATFLPKVWENIMDRGDFLRALKRKAGLPMDSWNEEITVYRYRTVNFSE